MGRSRGSEGIRSKTRMKLVGMSEKIDTEPLPGLQQDSASDLIQTVPLIQRFEHDIDFLKCRAQNVAVPRDASTDGGDWDNDNTYCSASASGRESTLSLSSDDTLNCDDFKSDSNNVSTDTLLTNEEERSEYNSQTLTFSKPHHERSHSNTSIKAGLLMSPVLLTEDVPVDVGASSQLSSVLENISLPLMYLPTTKQIVNGDKTVGSMNDGSAKACFLHYETRCTICSSNSEPVSAKGSESSMSQAATEMEGHRHFMFHSHFSANDLDRFSAEKKGSTFQTVTSTSDLERFCAEPDRITLNSMEGSTYNTVPFDPNPRLCDTSSLSSISTETDFSLSAVSIGDDYIESRQVCDSDEGTFMEVNLHRRDSLEQSKHSTLDSGFEDQGAKPKKKGLTGFLSRNLFSRKSKEDSAPGWKLFGRIPPKDSGHRDSVQITSDYYAKQRANQIAATQAKGQNSEVMSTTALILENRPQGLPSKSPEELEKHKQEYDAMVEAARKKEQRDLKMKKKRLQQQRRQEDKMVAVALMWNKDILPNWESMKQTKKVRDLWWMGLPTNVRGKVWQMAIGNDLNITQDLYEICRSRAEDRIRMIQESKDAPGSPETTTDPPSNKEASVKVIMLDVSRTFPQLCIFQKGGPYHDLMHNLLGAYACYRPDVGYVQGMSFIAAVLLLNMDVADAFVCFANLLNRPCQVTFFRMDEDMMKAYYKTFEDFFLENLPRLYHHFLSLHVTPNLYLMEWIFLLFSKSLPLDVACRVWDVFCRDGEEFLFQTGIGILHLYEKILLKMDFIHVAQFLTKLPEDLNSDELFKHVETIHMTIHKKKFMAVLALNKDFKGDHYS